MYAFIELPLLALPLIIELPLARESIDARARSNVKRTIFFLTWGDTVDRFKHNEHGEEGRTSERGRKKVGTTSFASSCMFNAFCAVGLSRTECTNQRSALAWPSRNMCVQNVYALCIHRVCPTSWRMIISTGDIVVQWQLGNNIYPPQPLPSAIQSGNVPTYMAPLVNLFPNFEPLRHTVT